MNTKEQKLFDEIKARGVVPINDLLPEELETAKGLLKGELIVRRQHTFRGNHKLFVYTILKK